MDKDIVHKELDLVQNCIKRMASNSFYLKGWYVSLVFLGANIANTNNKHFEIFMLLLLLLTCVFWYLDGFFLKMETLYRWKYEWLIIKRIKGGRMKIKN